MKYRVLDLFSGIGGFSLGLERTGGFETVAFCEIEPFPRRVLAKHWPEVPCYDDVRTLTADRLAADGISVDVICGGFPCQDISYAGNGAGMEGKRSGLWSEIARLTSELQPAFVIVENVAALLDRGMGRVLGDLAEIGYDAEWQVIRGPEVGIPQKRPRIWIAAYPSRDCRKPVFHQDPQHVAGNFAWLDGLGWIDANAHHEGGGESAMPILGHRSRTTVPDRERSGTDDRLSGGMDRYRAIGNTVLPQIPELIGRAILASN